MDIHITNLSFDATEEQLKQLFEPFGAVSNVHIVIDRRTRLKKGYAFVSMPNKAEAVTAMLKLKGVQLHDRVIKLEEASSRPGGKKAPSAGVFKGKRTFKKKLKLVTFDNEKPYEPKKRKKKQGAGRGTKY